MKQAIYIFSVYIGVVAFFTLINFRQTVESSLAISLLAMLTTGAIIFAVDKKEENGNL